MTNTNRPLGRRTRCTATSVAERSGMSISPSWQLTASNVSSSKWRSCWASSSTYRRVSGLPWRRAFANICGELSTPTTVSAPASAIARDATPWPHARSSTALPSSRPRSRSVQARAVSCARFLRGATRRTSLHQTTTVRRSWRGVSHLPCHRGLLDDPLDHRSSPDPPPESDASALGLVLRLGQGNERLPKRPATAARPRAFIEPQPIVERAAALALEERPGDGQVTGGVADRAAAEIDHGSESALGHQQVRAGDVAVDPDVRPAPGRSECRLPRRGYRLEI